MPKITKRLTSLRPGSGTVAVHWDEDFGVRRASEAERGATRHPVPKFEWQDASLPWGGLGYLPPMKC